MPRPAAPWIWTVDAAVTSIPERYRKAAVFHYVREMPPYVSVRRLRKYYSGDKMQEFGRVMYEVRALTLIALERAGVDTRQERAA